MPLYEYQCKTCGVRFERRQRMSEEPVKVCPECGSEVKRLIHPVGIIFKGKGFYVTDNRSAKSSTAVPKGESAPAKESTAEKSSDSKGAGEAKSKDSAKSSSTPSD